MATPQQVLNMLAGFIPDPVAQAQYGGQQLAALMNERLPVRERLAALLNGLANADVQGVFAPGEVPKPYEMTGEQLGRVFHGGPERITAIDPSRLQTRDYGFYGSGFYTAADPALTKGYGRAVSAFDPAANTKILNAPTSPAEAHPDLVSAVVNDYVKRWRDRAAARGKLVDFEDQLSRIRSNHLDWKNAVNDYAVAHGYDAVRYRPSEIVFKNTDVLKPVTGRIRRP